MAGRKHHSLTNWIAMMILGLLVIAGAGRAHAQTCSVAPLNLSGVVNTYWAGNGTLSSGATSVTLGTMRTGTDAITGLAANTTGFAVGDLMLIVQMQDADINDTNGAAYGAGTTTMAGYTALNSTGLFHYARVTAVGGSITFSPATTATFRTAASVAGSNGQRSYQIIRVPFSRTVNVNGTLRPMSWNGSTGGIVAAEAGQTMTLNAGVDAAGLGFRGGGGHRGNNLPAGTPGADVGTVAGSTYTGALPAASVAGNEAGRASKGEGVAGTPRLVDTRESSALTYGYTTFDRGTEGYPLAAGTGDFGRGAPGNAGGGGNRHDAGGGGGGNSGSGGKGGGAYNDGSDYGGFGGSAITGYAGTRLFLGGGGGSGQGWHNPPTTGTIPILSGGGRGGGVAILRADTITGSATVDVRGQSGFGMPTALGGCNLPLSAGVLNGLGGEGAGAGGTAYLVAVSSGLGSVIVDARGGNGGNAGHCGTNMAGPGGGGGGGLVVYYTNGTAPVSSVAGGLPGTIATTDAAPGALPGASQPGSGTGGSLPTEPSPPPAPCTSPDLIVAKTIANNIVAGQTGATYSLIVTNNGAGPKNAGNTVTVTDTLPTGLTATALSGTGWTCVLGTLTCTRTDKLDAGSSYPAITLTFSAANSVAGNTTGILNNAAAVALSGGQTESDATNNNATTPTYVTNVFKSVRVTNDPDTSGLANPTVGDTLTWSVFVSNPAGAAAITNFQVNDALPSGVTITATGAHTITDVNATCGAVPAKNTGYTGAGANGLIAGAQTLPANCVLRIDIPTIVNFGGAKSNQATLSGTGISNVNSDAIDLTTSAATLPTGVAALASSLAQTQAAGTRDPTIATVSYPAPTITKTFAPAGIAPGNTSVLTITINNTGAAVLTSAALTDSYPAGLVNATSPNGTSSCGGTVTAVSGTSSVALSGASVPAAGTCTITVNVTITGSGTYLNTIPIGALTNAQGASNTVAASATLYTNPTVAKSFSPTAVAPNTDSTLSIAITNPNTAALTLSNPGLTDSFPANLVATGGTVSIAGAGCAGFVPTTITAGATSLTVTAGTLPASGTCTLSFAVRSAIAGTYNNTTSGVTTTTTGGATGAVSNTASLGVGLINLTKFFSPSQIQSGGTSTITYTLTNPTATLQTAGTFLDTMVNMTIAAPGGAAGGTCVGASGNSFATGATSLNFTNLQIPASGSCTVTVIVTSSTIGTNPNAANGVSTALLTQGPGSNTDNLIVVGKPTIAKAFSPSAVPANSTSTMTFTLTNPNTIALTGINFTDTYPAGLTNNTPLTVGGTCTGVTHTAAAGGNTFNVTGGTIPAGSNCTITVVVLASGAGVFNNSTSGVASTQSGTAGAVSNVATLQSANPATITKAFGTSPIAQGGTSVITFTLTNPNSTALTNLNFTDTLVNMTVSSTTIGGTCVGTTNSPALVVGVASLNLSVPTLAGGASCTITVTVTSSTSGTNPNTTSGVTTTQTPVAGPASNTANLVVLMPPTITKAFAPTQIQAGGTSTITFTVTNPQATALTNVTFTDALANMTVASTTVGGTCTGETFSPVLTVGGTQINPTIPTLGASASCTITVQVTSSVPSPSGGHINTTGAISSTQTPTGGSTASATLTVLAPPTVTKTFTPSIVPFNTRSTLIFTVTNPNFTALTNISFTDDLTETPAALLNDDPQSFVGSGRGTCIGTTPASKAAGHLDPITFSGITLAAGSSCTVYMDVYRTATAGFYSNTVTNITSTETPTATTGGTDVLTVNDRLLLEKTFSVTQAQVNQVFKMRFTVSNPNSAGANQNGIDLSDTFPAGMQVANPPNIVTNGPCTPFVTTGITAGATTLTLTNVMTDLDNLETCYVEFDVIATTPGVKVNTVTAPAGGNPADLAGSSDNATVEIFAAPSIAKAFNPTTIGSGGTSTITFTLSSTNSNTVTNASFTDTLTNMSVSGAQTVGGTCVGTTPSSLTNGQTALSFSGISIPANGSCTITLVVTSTTVGTLPNTASGVTTTQTPTAGANSGAVNLTVVGSTLTKAFSPVTIQRGTNSRLTFTITNGAGNPAQPLLAFTDTLPTNVVIATPANTLTTCTGGTVTAASGGPTVSLSGASFTAGQTSCVVAVDVTSSTTGTYNNVTANISGLSPGLGAGGVNATLTVQNNASLTKAFAPTSIGSGGTSVLTFTITNGAGAGAYAGQGFTDNLPAGVTVAAVPGVANTCGGTVGATAGSTSISLANGSIGAAPATCTISVNVTSASLGNYVNNSANISGLAGGLTATGVNATLQVVGTALTKAFSPTVIGRGGTSTMTFTITNGAGNPAQTGLGFLENLPANVFVASAPTIVNNCGGTVTAAAGAGTIQLAGGSLAAAQASCTFSVNVTSAFVGTYVNNQSRIANASATMDTSGVNATLDVLENPSVTKSFTPSSMPVSGTSSLAITVTNANNVAITGLQVTDVFPVSPAAMTLANLTTSNTCGGTLQDSGGGALNVGDVGIRVTGGSIAANSSCTITVNVTAGTAGSYTNTIAIGGVQSTNAGVNSTAATAILNVLSPPTIAKAYSANPQVVGTNSTLTITITNPNAFAAITGAAFTDTNPAGVLNQSVGATTCTGGTVTAVVGGSTVQLSTGGVPAGGSCTVTISQSAAAAGAYNNTIAIGDLTTTNAGSNTAAANATFNVYTPPTISKAFGGNVGPGGSTTLAFTITNPAANPGVVSGISFVDVFPVAPAAMTLFDVTVGNTCTGSTVTDSGSAALNAGDAGVQVTGISLAAGASCVVTFNITVPQTGSYNNTSNAIAATTPLALTGGTAIATLTSVQPNLTKAFGGASIDDGVPTALVFTLTNGAGNPAQSGLGWTETLPASLRFTGASLPVAYSAGCSGAATVTATGGPPLNQIVLSNVAMAAATASCTVTIGVNGTSGVANVTGQFNASCAGSPAAFTNTSANITGETRVTDAATSQCLVVNSRPTLTKSFGANPQTIGVGQTATLTFTIDNTAAGSIARSGLGFTDTLPGAGALTATASTPQCGGGTVGVAGGNVITVSGASVGAGASCTITATVTGVTAGSYINGPTNSSISGATSNLNNGVTDQTLHVRQANLTKAFGAGAIDDNVPTALVFTLTNGAGNPAQSGLGWTETLPASLRFTGASLPVAYSAGCSGAATVTATGGPPLNQVVVSGISMAAATASCAVTIGVNGASGVTNVTGQFNASCAGSPAAFTNTSANITAETRVTDAATSQCLVVNSLPTITKAFGVAEIGIGQTTTLAFSIANTGTGAINRTGMTFSDALPAGLVVANPPAATTGAGCAAATLNGTADASTTFGATAVNVNAGQTCVITVTVRGTALGAQTNTTGNVAVAGMNNGVTAQTVTVVQPVLTKAFGGAAIDENVPTALVFTLTNGAGNPAQSGLGWTETLPASLRFTGASLPVAYSAGCSGAATVTATGGPPLNQIVLSSISMASSTVSCTVTIGVNGTSGVTNVSGQYNASCAGSPAAFTNTSANITAETRVTDAATSQCLVVNSLPTITKAFGAANIGIGQTTTLAFTIANTGTGNVNRTGMTFSDALPAGLVVANPPVATTGAGCAAATLTGTADASTSFGATGVNVNAGQTCVVTVTVRGATVGAKNNNPGDVTVTGMNNGVTTQTVTVVQSDVAKTFGAASINDAGTTTLVFTLTNGAGNPSQGGIALGDTLPAGLRFDSATPSVAYGAGCSGPANAAYASGTRILSGLTGIAMAGGTVSCTVTVAGLTNEAGQVGTCPVAAQTNLAANVTATNATNTSTNQCLSVSAISPNVAKTFGAASITDNATTTLVFTLTNQGTNPAQSGIALGDTLPSGLRFNTTTPAVAYGAGCSGPATAAYNTGTRILSGLTGIAMSNGTASCTVTLSGITNEPGQTGTCPVAAQTNLAANVTTTNATNVSTNQCLSVATINPNVAKTFGAASINDASTTTLVFTLTNQGSNPAQSGIVLGDTLPSGLRFNTTTPAVAYGAGCSGPATAAYNTGTRILSGLTGIAMSNGTASCTVTLSGITNEAGQAGTCPVAAQTNLAANVTTTNAANTSTDQCLTVNRINPNAAKTFGAASITDGNTTTLVFTLTNQGTNPSQSGIALGDTLPSGLRFNTTTPAVAYGAGCTGPATAAYNTGTRILSGLTGIAMSNGTVSCTVTLSGLTNEAAQVGACPVAAQTNLAANVTTTNATNTSTNQCLSVIAVSPNVAKTFGAALINDGATTTLIFTLTNQGTNPAQSGIALGDTLPSGLRFNTTTPAVAYGAGCTGPATASYNTGSRILSGLTGLGMNSGTVSCTVTLSGLTNETGQTGTCPVAAQTNLASNITTTNATNVSTDQCLSIRSVDLTIAKTHTGNFTVGTNGVYTVTVSNAATSPTTSGVITVVDTLPTGLGYVSAVGTGWACGNAGQIVTCTTSNAIAGGASASAITFTVSVAAAAQPSVLNNVTVSGGSEPPVNAGNNFANDNTLVNAAAVNQFLTNGAQTALAGTNVFYSHTFIAGMTGSVVFSTTNVTSPNNPAWTQAIYRDTDCNGTLNGAEGASLLVAPVAVVPGDQVCIIVRDSVPPGAPFNAQNQITVTATFNGSLTYTRTDITTVSVSGSAGLTLNKTVRNVTQGGVAGTSNQARPGDTLEYVITYANLSSGPITNIVINDSTPSFTVNVNAVCGVLPPNLLAPCTVTQPGAGASGAYQWAIPNGSLAPGQSGTVTFTVTVQP